MTTLIEKLKNLLLRRKQQDIMDRQSSSTPSNHEARVSGETAVLNQEMIVDLMQQLEQTNEGHYSCADSYALLDEYVDLVADKQQAELIMPLVKAHLDACPDCYVEFEVLLDILQSDDD